MDRRQAISRVGLILGGTVLGAEVFLTGCSKQKELTSPSMAFSSDTVTFLDEVGETILPVTSSSPGAKEAKIGEFMKVIVTDCYEEKDHKIFLEGIGKLNQASQKKYSKDFMPLKAEEKHDLLVDLDAEAKAYEKNKQKGEPTHYFTMMKQLTLWGYFTSEVGSKNALRYLPVPGRFDGCYPYEEGDKAWATI